MDCLVLVDIQRENSEADGFYQMVDISNYLTQKFRDRECPVVSFVFDETETSPDIFPESLLPQNIVFVREFLDSSLDSPRFIKYLTDTYGSDEFNIYLCGYSLEGSVYRLASQLISKNISCYIVNDAVIFDDENTGEEVLSTLADDGCFVIDSEVIEDMI